MFKYMFISLLIKWTTTSQISTNIFPKEESTLQPVMHSEFLVLSEPLGTLHRAPRYFCGCSAHVQKQQSSPQLSQTQHSYNIQSPNASFPHLWVDFSWRRNEGICIIDTCRRGNWGKEVYQIAHDIKSFQAKLSPGFIYIRYSFIVENWKIYFTLYKALWKATQEYSLGDNSDLSTRKYRGEMDNKEPQFHPLLLGTEAQEISLVKATGQASGKLSPRPGFLDF